MSLSSRTFAPFGWRLHEGVLVGCSVQVRGRDEVIAALASGEATLILMDRDAIDEEVKALCLEKKIPFEIGSSTDLWRMSADGEHEIMALVGRNPNATLDQVCSGGGTIWLLDQVEYATNIGFCVRTAEVSGANAVVITTPQTNDLRRTATRASMRADRFIPVIWASAEEALVVFKEHDLKIVVIEDCGKVAPWDVDLTGDLVMVVGAERHGVSTEMLEAADEVVRLPMKGFVPSYNLQVALSAVALESLRQQSCDD